MVLEVEATSERIGPQEWIDYHWPYVRDILRQIPDIWQDYWTLDSIFDCVMTGRWQAWGFGKSEGQMNVIVMTEVIQMPAKRFLKCQLAFGNSLDSMFPQIEATMERFAVEAGCDFCEVIGREGWEKKLRGRFRRKAVVWRADVSKTGVH